MYFFLWIICTVLYIQFIEKYHEARRCRQSSDPFLNLLPFVLTPGIDLDQAPKIERIKEGTHVIAPIRGLRLLRRFNETKGVDGDDHADMYVYEYSCMHLPSFLPHSPSSGRFAISFCGPHSHISFLIYRYFSLQLRYYQSRWNQNIG